MLVSFAISAYKQEKTIQRAVKAALEQDYSPLEIVISDDCSPDSTWAVINNAVASYKGPHKVVLNRNACNLGCVRNLEMIESLCNGELIVYSEGDDWSFNNRVSTIVALYKAHPEVSLIASDVVRVDGSGSPIDIGRGAESDGIDVIERGVAPFLCSGRMLSGATFAYPRSLSKHFTTQFEGRWSADFNLTIRALIVGPIMIIKRPLINYRVSGGVSTTPSKSIEDSVRINQGRRRVLEQVLADLECSSDKVDAKLAACYVRKKIKELDLYISFSTEERYLVRIWTAFKLCAASGFSVRSLMILGLSVLPRRIRNYLYVRRGSRLST